MEDTGGKKKKAVTTTTTDETGAQEDLKAMSLDDLHTLLNDVLEQEDYIRAIAIRDEINSREANNFPSPLHDCFSPIARSTLGSISPKNGQMVTMTWRRFFFH
jgi:hypothetical protein